MFQNLGEAGMFSLASRWSAPGHLALLSILTLVSLAGVAAAATSPETPADSLPAALRPRTSHMLEAVKTIGSYGSGAGEMAFPQGVAVDGRGRIFVADTGNHRILRFDADCEFIGEFGGLGFEVGQFDSPRDLFVGKTLSLLVLDGENLRITQYDLEGRLVRLFLDLAGETTRSQLGRVRPGGMALDPGGLLYVTDTAGDRLLAFESLSGELSVIGGFGDQPGRFHNPTGIAVDEHGTVAIADGGNSRVQSLDAFGGFVRAWPLSGEQAVAVVSVAWLSGGRLAVAEADSSRLSVYASTGQLIARLDERGSETGQLDGPRAITAGRGNRIYVADTENHRVQIFKLVRRSPSSSR